MVERRDGTDVFDGTDQLRIAVGGRSSERDRFVSQEKYLLQSLKWYPQPLRQLLVRRVPAALGFEQHLEPAHSGDERSGVHRETDQTG